MLMYIESFTKNSKGTYDAVIDFRNERDFKRFWRDRGVNPPSTDNTCILLENFTLLGKKWREGYCHNVDMEDLVLIPTTDSYIISSKVDLGGQGLL